MDEEKRKLVADATLTGMMPLWMKNLAENMPYILGIECPNCHEKFDRCRDVRELKPCGGPGIIIGASPAITRLKHLDMLHDALSDGIFNLTILATDRMLIPCLKAGIVPDFVCSVDGASEIATFYRHQLVDDNATWIKAVMNSMVHNDTIREFKGEKYIFHSTLDRDGPASLTRALHYMTHNSIIPGTGDVGGFCMQLGIGLDLDPICFIGMSYAGYELTDLADYNAYISDVPEDKRNMEFFRKHTHSVFGECWTSMLWESCWDTVKERIDFYHEKKGTRFINASGMGIIEGENVECMDFEKALELMK